MVKTGFDPRISRRDFVNGALVGSGGALLCPATRGLAKEPDEAARWNGPGGVGEYAGSNGNTYAVMNTGHGVRDGEYAPRLAAAVDTGEVFDLVVVGGGLSGLGAAYEFTKTRPQGSVLVLDNQEIFGGYAKANAFDVNGVRLVAPQASMNFIAPVTLKERTDNYFDEFGLPASFAWAEREGGDDRIKFQRSTSASIYHGEQCASTGYYTPGAGGGPGSWVKDAWDGDLARASWPDSFKQGLRTLRGCRAELTDPAQAARLDAMTFADYARTKGVPPEAVAFVTEGMCITGPQISALAAKALPGLDRFAPGSPGAELGERFVSFPSGNTLLARCFLKAVWPDALPGPSGVETADAAPLNRAALDRPGARRRLRGGALVVDVRHEGDPTKADHVRVVYRRGGELRSVRAKAVVMAIGAWVAKHVVTDLPPAHRAALDAFHYSPVMIVNVALRNWRFLDRLGVSSARWSGGFGFYGGVRRPMVVGGRSAPLHPDKPIVLTVYVPFPQAADLPLEAQGAAARFALASTPYADYERRLLDQLNAMFAGAGFDASRDVAGIVLNRWGHAFVTPGPGFYFGKDGAPSPLKTAAEPFGRIAFGQSGLEAWTGAAHAGRDAFAKVAAHV